MMKMLDNTLEAGTAGPQDLMDSLAESVSSDDLLGFPLDTIPYMGDLKECPFCNSANIKYKGNTGICNNCNLNWYR